MPDTCQCELMSRQWNPNTHRCEACGRRYAGGIAMSLIDDAAKVEAELAAEKANTLQRITRVNHLTRETERMGDRIHELEAQVDRLEHQNNRLECAINSLGAAVHEWWRSHVSAGVYYWTRREVPDMVREADAAMGVVIQVRREGDGDAEGKGGGEAPRPTIRETLDKIYEAGGKAWDNVADPASFIADVRGHPMTCGKCGAPINTDLCPACTKPDCIAELEARVARLTVDRAAMRNAIISTCRIADTAALRGPADQPQEIVRELRVFIQGEAEGGEDA